MQLSIHAIAIMCILSVHYNRFQMEKSSGRPKNEPAADRPAVGSPDDGLLILARIIARVHLGRSQESECSRNHEDDLDDRES